MHRVLPLTRGAVRVTRRSLATETAQPPKKRHLIRRIVLATTTLTATFYVGSAFTSFHSQTYHDFFSDNVPLGQAMLEFAESHHWDTLTVDDVVEAGTSAFVTTTKFVSDKINGTSASPPKPDSTEKAADVVKAGVKKTLHETAERAKEVITLVKTEIGPKSTTTPREKFIAAQVSDELQDLVWAAEAALAGKPRPPPSQKTSKEPKEKVLPTEVLSPPITTLPKSDTNNIYDAPLPVGFEPPPGFSRPTPPKKEKPQPSQAEKPKPAPLPLVAPSVSALTPSEPIISHLASTIDNLATFVASNPEASSSASSVLESAKTDLTALAQRIDQAREEERVGLEAKMDEQTREYTLKLMELEMAAQDKLDGQEEEFRKFFDSERAKMIQAYREKLNNELKTQTELINERLKSEVISQGIELQRRWIRSLKVQIENERGGRLSKLSELSASLAKLSRIALDNSAVLDGTIRTHALASAVRALSSSALATNERKPFREELRVLRRVTSGLDDVVVNATLDSLENTDTPDIGVEPFADLSTWFTRSVAPKVSQVALVPDENAGVLAFLTSRLVSGIRFRREGWVEGGDDVASVLARAEWLLNEKDLEGAAREVNQLKGVAKVMVQDWLEAARRRLEVEQAVQVVQAEATLGSLLVA